VLPENISALQAYVADTCASLRVTAEAREIAGDLFRSNPLSRPVLGPVRALTAGLLPEPLREQFGLEWGERREAALAAGCRLSRAVVPRLPPRLKGPPWFLMP
jgi:uncharacterized protein (DUF2236 family)